MAKDNITPEEKLLKIIENPDVEKRRVHHGAGKSAAPALASMGSILKSLHIDKDVLKYIDLKMANKIVAVLCVFFTIFWIIDFINGDKEFKKRLDKVKKEASVAAAPIELIPIPDVKMAELLAQVKKRNIFTLLPPKAEVVKSQEMQQLAVDLKLVGIIWSDNPQAMVEDSKGAKTYLVSTGDTVAGMKIKTIFKDKVIVTNGDQEWQLR
ncbi:MAG: hypothetical protein WC779_03445 [Candidatus Omnitrophota bacterium]|jgi:hypothetical protein